MAARVFVDVLIALVVSAATVFFVERFRRSRRSSDGTPALVSAAANTPPPQSTFDLVPPHQLPTFAAVGDLDGLKDEMRSTVGLLIANPDDARRYRITWNGLLFHGPPGVGKSFFVRALAGELQANLVTVATADLVTGHPGAGPSLVEEAFQIAAAHVPCVLFFDEFDAVAEARDSDASARDVLAQLLRSVEDHRDNPRLVIAASTNAVEDLDPAIVRPGRFDRQVR